MVAAAATQVPHHTQGWQDRGHHAEPHLQRPSDWLVPRRQRAQSHEAAQCRGSCQKKVVPSPESSPRTLIMCARLAAEPLVAVSEYFVILMAGSAWLSVR